MEVQLKIERPCAYASLVTGPWVEGEDAPSQFSGIDGDLWCHRCGRMRNKVNNDMLTVLSTRYDGSAIFDVMYGVFIHLSRDDLITLFDVDWRLALLIKSNIEKLAQLHCYTYPEDFFDYIREKWYRQKRIRHYVWSSVLSKKEFDTYKNPKHNIIKMRNTRVCSMLQRAGAVSTPTVVVAYIDGQDVLNLGRFNFTMNDVMIGREVFSRPAVNGGFSHFVSTVFDRSKGVDLCGAIRMSINRAPIPRPTMLMFVVPHVDPGWKRNTNLPLIFAYTLNVQVYLFEVVYDDNIYMTQVSFRLNHVESYQKETLLLALDQSIVRTHVSTAISEASRFFYGWLKIGD